MTKTNYALLLSQIAQETDPVAKQALIDQCYVFTEELTSEEIELFEYTKFGYIEANPGIKGNAYSAYVGVYFGPDGETT